LPCESNVRYWDRALRGATRQGGSSRTKGDGVMTEAQAGGGGRAEIERRVIERSLQDESFRRRLLADPKAALQEELGAQLPKEVEVRAVEETADTIYLVLPSSSPLGEGSELSDRELEAVSGGELAYTWDPAVAGCAY
jgi:Nitrile hydratase, alpha chain